MSELAADVLVALVLPDEAGRRLGRLELTDGAPSANTVETVCDRLDLVHSLNGRTGISSTTAMRLSVIGRVGEGPHFGGGLTRETTSELLAR